MRTDDEPDLDGFEECASCDGLFLPPDMAGELCRDCDEDVFGVND